MEEQNFGLSPNRKVQTSTEAIFNKRKNYPVELGKNNPTIFGEWKLPLFQDEIRESTSKMDKIEARIETLLEY